jgi:hypothetical protein
MLTRQGSHAVNSSQRWVGNVACIWAVLFAAPHVWWLLGVRTGFPGGDASYEFFMSSAWRVAFDALVVILSIVMVLITRSLQNPTIPTSRRRSLSTLAWIGSALLTLRGVAGAIADGRSDPVWWPTFLAGGILLGAVAWFGRREVAV